MTRGVGGVFSLLFWGRHGSEVESLFFFFLVKKTPSLSCVNIQ